MKYIFEQTDTGCVETLELRGHIFKKEHRKITGGLRTVSKDFAEQIEDAGLGNKQLLDKVDMVFDGFLASDFMNIAKMEDY